jgi:hypothetical protein
MLHGESRRTAARLRPLAPRWRVRVARSSACRGILDLAPVGARAVRMVATARELAHDALEVVRTRDLEEVPATCLDVVHIQQPRRH